MAKFHLTLLCLSLVLACAVSSNANTFGPHRRVHADLDRLVKKRTPVDLLADQASPQDASTPSAAQSSPGSSAAAQTTPASSVSVQATSDHASASASASAGATTNGGNLLSSVVSELLPTGSSATSSVPTASVSSSHSSNAPLASSQASQPPADTPTQSQTQSILYLTTSNAPTPSQTSSTSTSSSGMSHAAMTVVIVIAASVGAAVIVWTIIRKWKFRPSSDFEGRMQPIDWQPDGSIEDTGLTGQHSLSRASSFHSGSASGHADDQMRGPVGGYGTSALSPIPDHDFTAGPAHLAPVGGYADLARGPSPQPIMQESLGHAPSINRPTQYDQYGVPLHHGYNGY